MKPIFKLFLIAILFTFNINAQEFVKITYVANMGVLIQTKEAKVLIDAVHKEYAPSYSFPSDSELEKIVNGKGEYKNLDALLITHIHRDHFHAKESGKFLTVNKKARIYSSKQTSDSIKHYYNNFNSIKERIITDRKIINRREKIKDENFDLTILSIPHSSKARFSHIQNRGFLLNMNGIKILHVGDATFDKEVYKELNLAIDKIDIALLPSWFSNEDGKKLITEYIKPEKIIFLHISPTYPDVAIEQVLNEFNNAKAFNKKGEKFIYKK